MANRLQPEPKLIVVVGETASGKSAIAMAIAQKFGGEIINADSWQIYKGFDIGTAKPSLAEQAAIPHHLIDIAEPSKGFSAAAYKKLALGAIADVGARGKLPVLVGGTGLYIDGVIFDYSFLPAGSTQQRQRLAKLTIKELLAIINQQGFAMTGIDSRNKRRLIRLIETGGARPSKRQLRANTLVIGVRLPRAILRQRITDRVEEMFKRGLKHEVKALADRYGWDNEAMKGIGYREFQGYFNGQLSNAQLKRRIIKSTLDLAKRQRTWFKRHPNIVWVTDPTQALATVKQFLNK